MLPAAKIIRYSVKIGGDQVRKNRCLDIMLVKWLALMFPFTRVLESGVSSSVAMCTSLLTYRHGSCSSPLVIRVRLICLKYFAVIHANSCLPILSILLKASVDRY